MENKITEDWLKEKKACERGIVWFKEQDTNSTVDILMRLKAEKKRDWMSWLILEMSLEPVEVVEFYRIHAKYALKYIKEEKAAHKIKPNPTINWDSCTDDEVKYVEEQLQVPVEEWVKQGKIASILQTYTAYNQYYSYRFEAWDEIAEMLREKNEISKEASNN